MYEKIALSTFANFYLGPDTSSLLLLNETRFAVENRDQNTCCPCGMDMHKVIRASFRRKGWKHLTHLKR